MPENNVMKRTRKIYLWSLLGFLALSFFAIWFPYLKPSSLRSTEKPLCDLVPPFDVINAVTLMDGGSIILTAVDHQGNRADIFIPYDHSIDGYQHVYRYAENFGENPADQLTDGKTAIEDALSILRSSANDKSVGKCWLALECSRGAPKTICDYSSKISGFFP